MSTWKRHGYTRDEIVQKLLPATSRVGVFTGIDREDLLRLLTGAECASFRPDEVILREASSGAFLYVITDGEVSVQKAQPGGRQETELAMLHAGDSFGEMSLIDGDARSATVTATRAATLLRFPEELILNGTLSSARIYRNIARTLSQRLRRLDDAFVLARL